MKSLVLALLLPLTALAENEIGFIERFALAADREKALGELVPGSEEYYFFHALHYQNLRDNAKLNQILNQWRERVPDENEARRIILNREAILDYERDPQATLKYLIERLGIRHDHQQEVRDQKPNLPTQLDPTKISREIFLLDTLKHDGGFETLSQDALASLIRDQVKLSTFQRRSVPSSPTYKGEPVKVAGYGKLELVPNEGVYLLMSSWTAEGKEFAAGGHYGDLSPVVKCNKANEVIGLHSVALCRHGATPGLVFLSAAPAVQHKSATTTKHPSKSATSMKPEDFQKALAKALGLPDTASAEDILAALTAKLEAKDKVDDSAAMGADTKALSSGLDEIKTLLKKQDEKLTAQDAQIKLLSSGIDTNERAAILKQAANEGKQVPKTAAEKMPVADLKLLCAELPVTVPMDKRTPDGTTLLLSSSTPAVNPELAVIDKLTGISDADVAKYAAK